MTDFKLHQIWPAGCFCGPAVLAALTGLEGKGEIRSLINDIRKRPHNRGVMGMQESEISKALTLLGYQYRLVKVPYYIKPRMKLEDLARESLIIKAQFFYIVLITGHFVAMLDGRIADTAVRFGCPAEEHPARRKLVKKYWQIYAHDALNSATYLEQYREPAS